MSSHAFIFYVLLAGLFPASNGDVWFGPNANIGIHSSDLQSSTTPPNPPDCDDGGSQSAYQRRGQEHTLSIGMAFLDTVSECHRLPDRALGLSNGDQSQKQMAYDTARLFIQLCYSQPGSWGEFGALDGYNGARSEDTMRYAEYREWLKTVLYLNTTEPNWYCACANSFIATMNYFPGRAAWHDDNGALAIVKYLLESTKCPDFRSGLVIDSMSLVKDRYRIYHDTLTTDSLTNPMDTTLPSLEDLGLGLLRHPPQQGVEMLYVALEDDLTNVIATINPFLNVSSVRFTLKARGVVTFALYDALGHEIATNGIGEVLEASDHTIPIDGSKLAQGTYFARLSTNRGAVRTVQIAKQ